MCGRFAQFSPADILKAQFEIDTLTCEVSPVYNIAPTREVLVLLARGNERRLGRMRWGLLPPWMEDNKAGFINARVETLCEKPAFRKALLYRRCLVPADGYYEWEKKGKTKMPYFFSLFSRKPFAFAGLWEIRGDDSGEKRGSVTIITRQAEGTVSNIHSRMPVILNREGVDFWLNAETRDGRRLKQGLMDCAVEDLWYYRVSKKVNTVSFEGPSCIERIEAVD